MVVLLDESLPELRDVWESTSFALEARQCDRACVEQERASLLTRPGPAYRLTFDDFAPASATSSSSHSSLSPSAEADSKGSRQRHRVAVVRQEGSNGDREMLAAFHAAGLEAWDVNMYVLLTHTITHSNTHSHTLPCPPYTLCHLQALFTYPPPYLPLLFPLSGTICSTGASPWRPSGGWCSVEASATPT